MWPAVFDGTVRETVLYNPRSYLSRTYPLPYRTIKAGWPQCIFKYGFQMQDNTVKLLGRISMYVKCIGGCMQGAIVRVRIPGYV